MLLVENQVEQPITITTGFPYSTYYIYKDKAIEFFQRTHMLDYDISTHNAGIRKE
jgi:hypothetical protein